MRDEYACCTLEKLPIDAIAISSRISCLLPDEMESTYRRQSMRLLRNCYAQPRKRMKLKTRFIFKSVFFNFIHLSCCFFLL